MGASKVRGGGSWSSFHTSFDRITSLPNLFNAWREFRRGKSNREDVQRFALRLESNIFGLHGELVSGEYRHGPYEEFFVRDPKIRHIHKATVRDRVLHQAIFRSLNRAFNHRFIYDSYSCRAGKGTHAGVRRLLEFVRKVSASGRREGWVLKCDVRKFFDSVRHPILLNLLNRIVTDTRSRSLIEKVVNSFDHGGGRGLPLGNVTSQIFANVYMHELDRFIKHTIAERYYLRYCDDFVILRAEREYLEAILPRIREFLHESLELDLHPQKVSIQKLRQGTDFLGYVVFPTHTILRTKTKNRAIRQVSEKNLTSYLGMCSHAFAHKTEGQLISRAGNLTNAR